MDSEVKLHGEMLTAMVAAMVAAMIAACVYVQSLQQLNKNLSQL